FIGVTSKTRFVSYVSELRQIVGEPTFLIGLPEESRVGKSRAQNSFVPCSNQALRVAVQINYGEKVRCQPAAVRTQRKIFLMAAHHRNQNFVRQFKIIWIKAAENYRGVFV